LPVSTCRPHVLGVRTNTAAPGGDSDARLRPVNPAGAFPEVADAQKQKEQELQHAQAQGKESSSAGSGARSTFKFPAPKQQNQTKEDKPKVGARECSRVQRGRLNSASQWQLYSCTGLQLHDCFHQLMYLHS
jgi:hypothetical protein